MNKSVIIATMVLLAGGVLAFQFLGDNDENAGITPSPSPSPSVSATTSASVSPSASPTSSLQVSPSPKTHTLRITATGVNPKTITIKKGDTVTFVNDDAQPHWIASGPHPQHTTCPGFDPLKGLTTGQTFSFTFKDAKTCPFHDHINGSNSAFYGSIIVQ